ncbi:Ig-like domain-containing protein [Aliiroseovarius sp. PrR006]|uniref:Ig-like domain-containing protein n=1 Tax=Aliiroseovarius sp. PrR006 TaxID=2706883 RepID=UPI0013D0CF9B|nr:Ig-like domain-containing protein [Aliiroseovarius sp. PrR006]NDW51925.1 LysM peptidoglycan-binding domain-containing protein [Aliiroseovarius sp. PrR006]
MADMSGGAAGAGKIWIGVGAAVVVAALGYCSFDQSAQAPVSDPAEAPKVTREVPAVEQPVAPTADTTTAEAAPEPAASPDAPAFDVVRVDPEGRAVVAGHAEPGATVQLSFNGALIETLTADGAGNFVALLDLQVTEPGQLSLQMMNDAGEVVENAAPAQTVLIEPRMPAPTAEPEAPVVASTEVAPAQPEAPTEAEAPSAPRVLLADDEGITVLQDDVGDLTVQNVIIDAISYDDQGEVALSGRASGGGALRVYLDNAPIKTAPIPQDGQWRLPLPDVAAGIYTLRVDELAEDGTVTSRTETPFKREEVAQIAAATATAEARARVEAVTVQPGSTLWAIARDNLGEGLLYVRVFDANRDQIRDPDLIYPGQVFTIPE